MKIIKKIINEKNKIIIYKKNNKILVDKIFSDKNIKYLKNEILGYKYFFQIRFGLVIFHHHLKNLNRGKTIAVQ